MAFYKANSNQLQTYFANNPKAIVTVPFPKIKTHEQTCKTRKMAMKTQTQRLTVCG